MQTATDTEWDRTRRPEPLALNYEHRLLRLEEQTAFKYGNPFWYITHFEIFFYAHLQKKSNIIRLNIKLC